MSIQPRESLIIAGQHLPLKSHARIALQRIYGIGNTTSLNLCKKAGIDYTTPVKDITSDQEELLRQHIGELKTEGELRTIVATNIKTKMDTGSYQGRRHRYGLPVRGQRTKTNAKTAKKRKGRRS